MRIIAAKLANPIQVGGLEKGVANLWRGKIITKKAHAGRGQETKWEMSVPIWLLCAAMLPATVQAQFT